MRMTLASEYHIYWQGPFSLLYPDTDSCFDCPAIDEPGVYLWAFRYLDGYLVYLAGMTFKRSFARRLPEDRGSLFRGEWTTLDAASAEQGIRSEKWHGTDWEGYDSPERKAEARRRKDEIKAMALAMLGRMRVFLGPLPRERRLIARVEAAIIDRLYDCGTPFSKIPDTGMQRSSRWANEPSITIYSHAPVKFYCIPDRFVV